MPIPHHFCIGDRVDCAEARGARVRRVGPGTLWLEATTPQGASRQLTAPVSACRHHIETERLAIGAFTLRRYHPGKLWIALATGEAGEFDEAQLESLLERFWRRHF